MTTNRRPQGRSPSRQGQSRPASAGQESWDHVAAWYDSLVSDRGADFHQNVIIPGVLRLLDLQQGERVLDLACGQGVVSRALRKTGAEVTGIDASPQLIRMAKQRSAKDVRYVVGDVRRASELLEGERFGAAVCVLALENMDPMEPVFQQCQALPRPGGRLVVVTVHPAFRIPRQSSWGYDETHDLLFRAINLYLSPLRIPIDMRPFKRPSQKVTWTYHRPIHAYVNGLAGAGLWVNAMEEWPSHRVSQPGPRAKSENRARKEFPLFMALCAVKV